MNTNKALLRPLTLSILATGFLFASATVAQQRRIELPDIPLRGMDMGVIMDGTMFSSGSNMSVQMSVENGVKKIRAVENGVKTYIEEDPSSGIVVKITKRYGPEEMDALMEEHPDLYMSVKDFPTQTEDAEEVEVSVGVTKKYEAANVEELKEKHPNAHEAYEKYSSGNNGGMQIFRGQFGRDLLLPEIRITPEFRGIDPGDIRIHDDEDAKEKKSGKDDKDT